MRESAYKKAINKSTIQKEYLYHELAFHLKLFADIQDNGAKKTETLLSEAKNK